MRSAAKADLFSTHRFHTMYSSNGEQRRNLGVADFGCFILLRILGVLFCCEFLEDPIIHNPKSSDVDLGLAKNNRIRGAVPRTKRCFKNSIGKIFYNVPKVFFIVLVSGVTLIP